MKKSILILMLASVVLFTSCAGASVGALLGGALGSAVGGLSGGPRGHDAGMLIGAVGGAMVGAALETAADTQQQKQQMSDQQKYQDEKARLAANREARANREDIDFGDGDGQVESVTLEPEDGPEAEALIQIRNVRFIDADGTNTISRGEQCSIVFEIYNAGDATAYDIEPAVVESSGNSHILISPSILIESLAAHKGVKYTARLVADNSLRDGTAHFTINVSEDGNDVGNGVEFSIPTSKK